MTAPDGRRERKKALTRQAIADAALRLFLDRGYDAVGVKDVAEAADVAVTTLFKHFPSKEALVFDQDDDVEAALVAAVRHRAPGVSIPRALGEHIGAAGKDVTDPRFAEFLRLVEDTPALREHAHRMWMRHEAALAGAIAVAVGAPDGDVACTALARFALDARAIARRQADPPRAVEQIVGLLDGGWSALHPATEGRPG